MRNLATPGAPTTSVSATGGLIGKASGLVKKYGKTALAVGAIASLKKAKEGKPIEVGGRTITVS
jgi:hypothetical protein